MGKSGFAGVWSTNFGRLELQVAGNRATGRYEPGGGCVQGTLWGRILQGTWQQKADDKPGLSWGRMILALGAGGKAFQGKWWYSDHNAPAGGAWCGHRWDGSQKSPDDEVLALSRQFACRFGSPVVDRVGTRIFTETIYPACMDCTFCFDTCCQYGATVDMRIAEQLESRAEDLEAYVGVPRSQWFDGKWRSNPSYPGGKHTRTKVADGSCVFLDRNGRGCLLHRYAVDRGIAVYQVKPLACNLFPLWCENGLLGPELDIIDRTLICLGKGVTLYRRARDDVAYYFGPELIAELDAFEDRCRRQ